MSFCESIFNKDIRDLKFEDIETYFLEPREENESLEFKSGLGNFDEMFVTNIIRTIVALLNSSGGVLIWGAPKEIIKEKGMPKITQGKLVPLEVSKSKDYLINKISTAISYMPTGIKVEKFEKGNQYVYVFEVSESLNKPHQCTHNGIYYIRLDGQTKPAPHYIVDALFKQVKFCHLVGSMHLARIKILADIIELYLDFTVENTSKFQIEKFLVFTVESEIGTFTHGGKNSVTNDGTTLLHYGAPRNFSLCLQVNRDSVTEEDEYFKIIFYFAGESSLSKASIYTVDVTKYGLGSSVLEVGDIIMKAEENRSFY